MEIAGPAPEGHADCFFPARQAAPLLHSRRNFLSSGHIVFAFVRPSNVS